MDGDRFNVELNKSELLDIFSYVGNIKKVKKILGEGDKLES